MDPWTETVVAEFLETFNTWLPLVNFANAKWIWWQWVGMCLKKCASGVWEVRRKRRQHNKRPAMDLWEHASKYVRGNLPCCQVQQWWLWFIECRTATMTRHAASSFTICTQMWGTGRSWLISSRWIVARKKHTVWPRYPNATWPRKN